MITVFARRSSGATTAVGVHAGTVASYWATQVLISPTSLEASADQYRSTPFAAIELAPVWPSAKGTMPNLALQSSTSHELIESSSFVVQKIVGADDTGATATLVTGL